MFTSGKTNLVSYFNTFEKTKMFFVINQALSFNVTDGNYANIGKPHLFLCIIIFMNTGNINLSIGTTVEP